MDIFDRIMFGVSVVVGIGLVMLVIAAPFAIYYDYQQVEHWKANCAMKGGELLDHTYRTGKTTHHSYVCIDPKFIIPYQD